MTAATKIESKTETTEYVSQKALDASHKVLLEELETLKATFNTHPGVRISHHSGNDAAKRLADALDKAKNVQDARNATNVFSDDVVKSLIDLKKIEGKYQDQVEVNKSAIIWGGAAVAVVAAAGSYALYRFAYDNGREQGQLDMVDGKFTIETHSVDTMGR